MYNINMYTYTDKPTEIQPKFGICPLNDPGLTKYRGPDSHNYNYVSRINPKVFREIVGMDYETLVAEQERMINEMRQKNPNNQDTPFDKSKQMVSSNGETVKEGQNEMPQNNNNTMNLSQNKVHFQEDQNNNANNMCNQNDLNNPNNQMENQHNYGNSFNNNYNNNYNNSNYNNNYKNSNYNNSNYNNYNYSRPLGRSSSTFYNSYHRKRDFKENYGYDNIPKIQSKKDAYNREIKKLQKENLSNDEFNSSHSNYGIKKKYDGFCSYAVPRTDIYNNNNESAVFNRYNNGMKRSLSCTMIKENTNNEFDAMQKSNNSMYNNIALQTNKNFLKMHKLPDLTTIPGTLKRIRNINIGVNKDIGEKYNPYTYLLKPKNRVAVNYVGALFQH